MFKNKIEKYLEDSKQKYLEKARKIDETLSYTEKLADEVKKQYEENKKQKKLMEEMIFASGGYMWRKDAEGLYLYCDPSFCRDFFGLEVKEGKITCDVQGRSDIDLLNDFRERTGKQHTFDEVCVNTDNHCFELKCQCRYIEIGYIGENIFILDVIKTPLFNGKYSGTVGFAWNRTKECDYVYQEIQQGELFGWNTPLVETKTMSVYWIHRQECIADKFMGINKTV